MTLRTAAVAALVVGAVLMLGFESTVTRVLGVAALFAFVVCGVFAIADPAALVEEETPDLARREPPR